MKVLHIIIGPETGGAKNMLFKLVNNSLEINHFIVSLTSLGSLGRELMT